MDAVTAERLYPFVRSFGFTDETTIAAIAARLWASCEAAGPQADPLATARQATLAWLSAQLGVSLDTFTAPLAAARAAFVGCEAARRWPQAFLASEAAPAELVAALRASLPVAQPPHAPAMMLDQELGLVPWGSPQRRRLQLTGEKR